MLHNLCPICGKHAKEESRIRLSDDILVNLRCGHSFFQSAVKKANQILTSADGRKTLYPFQALDLETIEQANVRCLLTYECGLGKTITSAFTLANHFDELTPILVIAKSAVLPQWMKELVCVLGDRGFPFILSNGKMQPMNGYPIHLISFDMCRRVQESLTEHSFKTVVIDECQHIKSMSTSRTKAVQAICSKAKHVIALSATPIKNHAAEYFPILNILQPERFPIYESFIRYECDSYRSGYGWKVGGLKNPVDFKEKTQDFIIYHTREEVLPDLPKERRNFNYLDIEDKNLQKAYDKVFGEFEEFMDRGNKKDLSYYSNVLEYLTKMRHITGLAKVNETCDRAEEFLLSTERKLVIYHHHIDVGDLIEERLNSSIAAIQGVPGEMDFNWKCLRIRGGMAPGDLERVKEEFLNGPARILIASTLAAGEGLNLQPVSDAMIIERQWNSVNEEQAERRFSRPGATASVITIDYLLAIGTVDDYLTEIVEGKRKVVKEALTGETQDFSESTVISQLADALMSAGKPRWRLS
jgi:SNF2 family DNA or RNA helicase